MCRCNAGAVRCVRGSGAFEGFDNRDRIERSLQRSINHGNECLVSPTSQKTFTFVLPNDLKIGLQTVRARDGVSEAEQIRRAITAWLKLQGITSKAGRKRAAAGKRP